MTDVPTIVYDDDCGFCTWWTSWAARNADVEQVGFSDLGERDRERLPSDFESCVHLLTDEAVYSCGEAVERVVALADSRAADLIDRLRTVPGYETKRERLYRWGAERRDWWGKVVREPPPAESVRIPVEKE